MELLQPTSLPPDLSWQDKIAYLAWRTRETGGIKPDDIPVKQWLEPGRYLREFTLPPNFMFFGRVHRKGHVILLVSGEAHVMTPWGYTEHRAPDAMQTVPGYAAVAYTLTEVVARSIHLNPTNLQDFEDLEDEFFEPADLMLARGQGVQERVQKWLAR